MQDLFDQLKAQIPKEELELTVNKKIEQYHHLITLESAQYLVALEKFGVENKIWTIEQAKLRGSPSTLHVRVKKVYVPQIYSRGIQQFRTQRIEVEDESASATIVVYNQTADEIDKCVLVHDIIEIGPLKFRLGEFYTNPNATIKRLKKGVRAKISDTKQLIANYEGTVVSAGVEFTYKSNQTTLANNNLQTQIATSFEIEDESGRSRVVFWNSPSIAKHLKVKTKVEIENGVRRNSEIHITKNSRLVFEKDALVRPIIDAIDVLDDKVIIHYGQKNIEISDLQNVAYKFGINKIPDGINPKTAIQLKKSEIIGKKLPADWEEKDN